MNEPREPRFRHYTVYPELDPSEPYRAFVLVEDSEQRSFDTAREAQSWIAASLEQDGHSVQKVQEKAKAIVELVMNQEVVLRSALDSFQ